MTKAKIFSAGTHAPGFITGILDFLKLVSDLGTSLVPAQHPAQGIVVSLDGDGPVEITQQSLGGVVQDVCPCCFVGHVLEIDLGPFWRN